MEINIDFDKGLIYVRDADGEEQYVLDEPYLVAEYDENGVRKEHPISKQDFIGPQTVPEGCVFVMGDNRNSSHDSRSNDIGMVDARLIIGRVYAVVYPISEMRWVR